MTDTSDDDEAGGLFTEPDGFYQAEKEPSFVSHKTCTGQELTLRLVGHNPLWGHLLWQGGRTLSDYLEHNAATLIDHKTILELGAGAGLPSLICALNGAHQVVVTDYPDADLIENLRHNITHCPHLSSPPNIVAEGYLWGADTSSLTSHLPLGSNRRFDVLILADLLFNHSEHAKLLRTVQRTLAKSPEAQALVFFTPYRPWLYEKDLAFFDLARAGGFEVDKIFEKVMERVMFEEDPGDELLRRTVFGYRVRWKSEENSATA
ncbi:nicotinamide N-methyltransferas-like protein Nnt1 [Teratosphaeria nubilosa]|uniref:Protein N-terminal and lysine N-methyltransferase EFM7 n=1 Tax=Teratosphaeria nubilosa TaxID=161662 RepID=A0A6G1LMU5_9PEZI|nr:nicotinamide N-methyltransferas-like protein Nnt1 [Teratosphaeria nubilosa]